MSRKVLHDRTSLTTLAEWGDPVNGRTSLKMVLYWHARVWKFSGRRTYQPPLYARSPRRLHARVDPEDTRTPVAGEDRRWRLGSWRHFEAELARVTEARKNEEAALRLYDIVTGKTPLPEEDS